MGSPFPGMDPFLEDSAFWADFHQRFTNYWCEAIADRLPSNYEAALGEKIHLERRHVRHREIRYADVGVVRRVRRSKPLARAASGAATLEPVSVPLLVMEEVRETFIEIRQLPGRELVAVLELLSPGNKVNPGRGDYLTKRNALLRQPIHLVELDLLVGGHRLPTEVPLPTGDYYAIVARSERRPHGDSFGEVIGDVYAWTVRQRLPVIPIPLLAPDPDIHVDLQDVLTTAYDRGRFAKRLNYGRPPKARWAKSDLTWVVKVGKAAKVVT